MKGYLQAYMQYYIRATDIRKLKKWQLDFLKEGAEKGHVMDRELLEEHYKAIGKPVELSIFDMR